MGANRGECPAIVQGPDNGDIVLFNIAEQYRDIDKTAVQVMQMNNIGRVLFNLPDKTSRFKNRKEAFKHSKPRQKIVNTVVKS